MSEGLPATLVGEMTQLVIDMDAMRKRIDAVPEDQDFTQDDMITLDDVRGAALRLAHAAEATIETFEGSS